MYRILYNGELMHDPSLNDDRFVVFEPTLKEEANMAASLTFVIYPTNARYNDLTKMIPGTVEAYDDNDLIFRGRVISDDQGWLNQKTVTCESDVAYLNDTIVRPYSYNGTVANYLRQLITSHNSQVAANKQFTVRNVTVTDPNNNIVRSSTQYPTTWAEIKEKLIDNLGGYLVTEYTGGVMYIDYLADITTTAYQTIELSKNLLSFSREIKGEDYITALIPLGATVENSEERVTIKSVNSGNDYIVSPAASTYGLIFGTEVWDDVTVPANLLTKAQARLAERARGETTIQLSALDLHLLDDNVHSLRFLSYVNCIDDEHDFSGRFLITQKTTDMTNPGNSTITFGKTFGGLTGYTSKTKGDVENIVRDYVKNEKIFEVNESISTLSSELTQTASEIRAEVSEVQTDVGDLETRMTSAEAAIVVNANNISTKVSQTDYNGSTIASLINQSASTVTIQAQHIKLEGAITANQTFSINSSGFMTATGGSIGGWSIGANVLTSSGTFTLDNVSTPYSVFMQAPANAVPGNAAFAVRFGEEGSYTYPFLVQYNGTLTATKANITGTISGSTITGSTISGSNITGETIDIVGTGNVTNGTATYNKYRTSLKTEDAAITSGGTTMTYKTVGISGRMLNSSSSTVSSSSIFADPNGTASVYGSESVDIGIIASPVSALCVQVTSSSVSAYKSFYAPTIYENNVRLNQKVSGMAADGSLKSINASTWTSFDDTYTLTANHRYLVTYNVEFASNASGYRLTRATIGGSTAGNISTQRLPAISGQSVYVGATFWIQASSSSRTLGFDAYHTASTAINGTLRYQVIDFGT